jgi:hypothetical protein
MPDIGHDRPIFHRLAGRDFLERDGEIAIRYACFVLEHFPERLNEPCLFFGGVARADDRQNRGDGRVICRDVRVISRVGREHGMDKICWNAHRGSMDADQLGSDDVPLLSRQKAILGRNCVQRNPLHSFRHAVVIPSGDRRAIHRSDTWIIPVAWKPLLQLG